MSEAETGEMVKKKPKVKRCPTCGAKKNDISYTELYELAISRAREVSDLQKQVAWMRLDVQRAIQYLGIPVMDYSPKNAVKEYDKKIAMATEVLLGVIAQLTDDKDENQ
jgi:hypothetical protein